MSARVWGSALFIPLLLIGADLALRGPAVWHHGPDYPLGALLSALLWGLTLEATRSSRRYVRAGALGTIVGLGSLGVGLQAIVYSLTHAYLARRALILALGMPHLGHAGYVAHNVVRVLAVIAVPGALAFLYAHLRIRRLGHRRTHERGLVVAATAVLIVTLLAPFDARGVQPLPPDVLFVNGLGGPLLYAVGIAQKPKALPQGAHAEIRTTSKVRSDAPPLVLILGESIRRDAVCSARHPSCGESPRVDAAAPDRIGLARGFSVASCTELASTSLWTGMSITTNPTLLARAPLLWDWAKGRGYRTAYVTSQNLLFQQSDQFLRGSRIDFMREARDEIPDAPIDGGSPDEHTIDPALAFVEADGAPAFVVVHHANTHVPYRQVPGFTTHPDDALGTYRNSVAFNDSVVGDLVARLRRGARGKDAIVIYLSDHGEAFQDHGISYHSFDLYEEQVDVPMWIDAPPGSISEAARRTLREGAATRPTTTYDVSATLIDLMGGLDDGALAEPAAALAGTSLLHAAPTTRDVYLWNCPSTRECAFESFGVVRFPRKLHYVGREGRYVCSALDQDPLEKAPLPATECDGLRAHLDATFGSRAEVDPQAAR